jgi:hypothetical protein
MCRSENPSHNLIVFLGQIGIIGDCECLVKWNPRLRGPGLSGAGTPGAPGYPK